MREVIVYTPEGRPTHPALMISLHGFRQDAQYQEQTSGLDAVADTAGFIVAYPNGEGSEVFAMGHGRAWDISGTKDTEFIATVIDSMAAWYNIDRQRVYLSGFSMGGMMTYHCMTLLSDRIAAFAPISGIPVDYRHPSGARAVPLLHTHGTDDRVVFYDGDAHHPAGGYGPVAEYVRQWAVFDGCDTVAEVVKPYPVSRPGIEATLTRYVNRATGVEVELLSLPRKGHWISNDTTGVMTCLEVWNFCRNYRLEP
jgi:poly(3-hydroxybutyrate) depolymerase